jgi:hypothetical protein
MEEYTPLISGLGSADDVSHFYTTESKPRFGETYQRPPSLYAAYPNASTAAFREPSDMQGTGRAMQDRSGKTFYSDMNGALKFQDWMSNENIGTRVLPDFDENGKVNALNVQVTEPHPRRKEKAGQIVERIPVSTSPEVGKHPIELFESKSKKFGLGESPVGTKGKYHIGNQITRVLPIGGGGYRPGVDNLQHSLNPLKLAKGGMIDKPLMGGQKTI